MAGVPSGGVAFEGGSIARYFPNLSEFDPDRGGWGVGAIETSQFATSQ
ncbi:MAG: hypothetical protein ACFB9N_01350 [Geitlerinemataceae cyanobacterium]